MGNWISDLKRRLDQLASLTSGGAASRAALRGSSSTSVWLGGLLYPGAFVAATRQVEAQSLGVSLEELHLEVIVGSDEPAENGYMITGLALEGGATFDAGVLQPSSLMRQSLPASTFRWTRVGEHASSGTNRGENGKPAVEVPVYLNSTRLNFVLKVELASAVPAQVFAKRGTALIAWSMI